MPPISLLKFQIGPVQDFISQARSTRDLWSGSYLLSFLAAAGIRQLISTNGDLVFPAKENQPLLQEPEEWVDRTDHTELLTPNLPNLFIARFSGEDPDSQAKTILAAIKSEWENITSACWLALLKQKILLPADEKAFKDQAARHLSISWQITPETNGYAAAYALNGWQLDAVRQTRDFSAIPLDGSSVERNKDSLSGKETALAGGKEFQQKMEKRDDAYANLFKHSDHLSAIALIKRVWHLAYLVDVKKLKADAGNFKIRSTHAIAARTSTSDDDENTDKSTGEKYLAAIAFDGDAIGKWIGGGHLANPDDLESFHQQFSGALSAFALGCAASVVSRHDGLLIYAGGDDVVALVPADTALACAEELRREFQSATGALISKDKSRPDASAGIAIAHFKSPLQDLIREAQLAEKDAKNIQQRAAFSITLLKRSGEISKWGGKWEDGATPLFQSILALMKDEGLSAKFPHRVCQLLEPYLIKEGPGLCDSAGNCPDFPAAEIITREFLHAAERQGNNRLAESLKTQLQPYLDLRSSDSQTLLTSVIGLCTTLAFVHRNRTATA